MDRLVLAWACVGYRCRSVSILFLSWAFEISMIPAAAGTNIARSLFNAATYDFYPVVGLALR